MATAALSVHNKWLALSVQAVRKELESVYNKESAFRVEQVMFMPQAEEEGDPHRLITALMNNLMRTVANVCSFHRGLFSRR